VILNWTTAAWEDYQYWKKHDKKIHLRINELIRDIEESPFLGIGKPEPLKFNLSGKCSRRINKEHRLVYEALGNGASLTVLIYQCRYHY
jgi:toxin YoeB